MCNNLFSSFYLRDVAGTVLVVKSESFTDAQQHVCHGMGTAGQFQFSLRRHVLSLFHLTLFHLFPARWSFVLHLLFIRPTFLSYCPK